ncbi:hypothetical protein [Streptomyces sulphureus]|uniref:hypothetical protein n=1 Tax=Streptomyces sulphureus TaxID=47758 RepID=UPI00037448CD|nr:hypothetical protein [Streptomyces sulphureus]
MPTPYGSRGGMAFSAEELRVLRSALALALKADPGAADAHGCVRLADAVEEAVSESRRLRSFLLADLARYREALPGAAAGYLAELEEALTAGYLPRPDDLAALRSLCTEAAGPQERARREALLLRCERIADLAVRTRLPSLPRGRNAPAPETPRIPAPARPAPEPHALPADAPQPQLAPAEPVAPPDTPAPDGPVLDAAPEENGDEEAPPDEDAPPGRPSAEPEPQHAPGREEPEPPSAHPAHPVPTPAEVFPPRRPGSPAQAHPTPAVTA